jgi:hypothetical protein
LRLEFGFRQPATSPGHPHPKFFADLAVQPVLVGLIHAAKHLGYPRGICAAADGGYALRLPRTVVERFCQKPLLANASKSKGPDLAILA